MRRKNGEVISYLLPTILRKTDRSTLKHQFSTEYGIQREVSMSEELKNIEIYYDNTFIEIYLNDGKDTMTLRAFPENVEINLI